MNNGILGCWLLIVLAGCSNEPKVTVLTRVEEEAPVDRGKLKVTDCKINDLDASSPVRAKPNESFELTGKLAPGEWSTDGIFNGWKYEDGDRPKVIRGIDGRARHILIGLILHGADQSAMSSFGFS